MEVGTTSGPLEEQCCYYRALHVDVYVSSLLDASVVSLLHLAWVYWEKGQQY